MNMPDGEVFIFEPKKMSVNVEQKELVTCKHCKFCEQDTIFGFLYCDGRKVNPDHWCSLGERKEDTCDYFEPRKDEKRKE